MKNKMMKGSSRISVYIRLARPKQWIKQILVLSPLISVGSDLTFKTILWVLLAFMIFTLNASGIYYFNDYRDFEKDRHDSSKMNRPVASGLVTKFQALIGASGLLVVSLLTSIIIFPLNAFLIIVSYSVLNILYSTFKLKNFGNLGAFIVAIGFSLRWAFGSEVLHIQFSWWAFVMIAQLALFMLAGKRFQSHKRQESEVSHDYWLLSLVVHASIFVATYSAFVAQDSVQQTWTQPALLLSTLPIGLGIARYLEIVTHPGNYKFIDSTESMLTDLRLYFLGFLYFTVMFIGRILNG